MASSSVTVLNKDFKMIDNGLLSPRLPGKLGPMWSVVSTAGNLSPVKEPSSTPSNFLPIKQKTSTGSNLSPTRRNTSTASNHLPVKQKISMTSHHSVGGQKASKSNTSNASQSAGQQVSLTSNTRFASRNQLTPSDSYLSMISGATTNSYGSRRHLPPLRGKFWSVRFFSEKRWRYFLGLS